MVTIGEFSKELCGGTHCSTTGEVGAFLIARESSTAAGIRRIEAVTGQGALEYVQQERRLIQDLTSSLKISKEDLLERIQDLLDRNKKLEKEIERLKTQSMRGTEDQSLVREQKLDNGRRIHVRLFPEADQDQLGRFVDDLFASNQFAAVVGASLDSGTLAVRVMDGADAATLFRKYYAVEFGGGGGGRKDFAKGGLKKLKDVPPEEALNSILTLTVRYFSERS
jgi:alanyl-tRNA synthetase